MSNQTTDRETGRRISQHEFRATMSRFASGLTVVAGLDKEGAPAGLACQSFSSLSLEPQLVLVCIDRGSTSWARIAPTGRFGISILAAEQQEVCAALGRRAADKFASVPWHAAGNGTVYIDGALATVDCRIAAVHEAGDHDVVIAEVRDLAVREDGAPLLYYRNTFGKGDF